MDEQGLLPSEKSCILARSTCSQNEICTTNELIVLTGDSFCVRHLGIASEIRSLGLFVSVLSVADHFETQCGFFFLYH